MINNPDTEVRVLTGPQTVDLGDDCYLRTLYPFGSLKDEKVEEMNNTSVVSKLKCRGASFLFIGDIEEKVKKKLIDSGSDLDAQVLKASHHGAGENISGRFVEEVSPEVVVVSVGENDHGHPNESYLRDLEEKGIKVLRTDKKGDIIFTKNKTESSIEFGGHDWKDILY